MLAFRGLQHHWSRQSSLDCITVPAVHSNWWLIILCCAGLLQQVIEAAAVAGVPLSGENALQRYDQYAFDRIAESAFGLNARAGRLEQLTFLRMGDLMFDNWDAFSHFLQRLRSPPMVQEWVGY